MTQTHGLWKVEGAGNDFVLGVGRWADRISEDATLVYDLCRRKRGIGADGALALYPDGANRVRLVYRNRDGQRALFCANGTRCAALAAARIFAMADELTVATEWVDVPAIVRPEAVSLDLPAPTNPARDVELRAGGRLWRGTLITLGVPHLIVPTQDVEQIDLAAVGPALRHHTDIGAEGANVSFVSTVADRGFAIRTWERGVEAETLCCGSAVVASAYLEQQRTDNSLLVCFPKSGDTLTVEPRGAARLRLTGPARIVAEVRPDPGWVDGI